MLIGFAIGVWSKEDLNHILGQYGVFIVERTGTDIDDALAALIQWRQNIWVIQQLIQNDVSSTKIRLFLKREMSVRYLVPAPVITVSPPSRRLPSRQFGLWDISTLNSMGFTRTMARLPAFTRKTKNPKES